MSEILSDTKFYTLESKSTLQAALSTLRSGVVYTLVACVGVIIGVVGTSIVFEKTKIEPKIAEVAKKIEDGVKNISSKTVVQATTAFSDMSKSGEHVAEAVKSLVKDGNVEDGTSNKPSVEISLPLSVGDSNATTMSTGLGQFNNNIQGFQGIGGGRNTKNNKKTSSEQKVNVPNRKPRTKKCLVTKGNQMYMSFCV
jgi:isopropylmalate/homocitrate/citramalate synthase